MKKTWILLVISILGLALFSACASNADTMPSPSPMASTTPSAMPQATQGPMVSIAPATEAPATPAGVNSIEDAQRVSDNVAEEVEKLSELDTAEAVVAGNIALVGVKYDAQYQGGLTERLTKMVEQRVETIDKTITAVHVTDDEATLDKIAKLREELNNKSITFEELQTQLLDIGSGIAGGSTPQVTQPQTTTGA
ncbi:MAG: YhcN/YlaJ family sporulation lipoprotein [Clostridiales bacterium]|nr:YhcN/YlaJ family sporulation lipoprotein [Clostridiales bacterium]